MYDFVISVWSASKNLQHLGPGIFKLNKNHIETITVTRKYETASSIASRCLFRYAWGHMFIDTEENGVEERTKRKKKKK